MDEIKSKKELLEENKSLRSKIESLKNTNFRLTQYTGLLKESDEQFRAFANQTTEGITVADLEGNYVYVNPGFCAMSGYSEEELLDMTVFDMNSKEEGPERFAESKNEEEGKPILVQLQKKDKTKYFAEIVGNIITVGDEKLVLGTIRDITKRTLSDRELKQSKSELIEAQRIGALGNWKLDYVNKKLTWSSQVYKIFGVEPTYELTDKTVYNLVHQDDKKLLGKAFVGEIKENEKYHLEFRIVNKDGSVKWVLERGECVSDSSGNLIEAVGTIQDITNQKLAREKLLASENRYKNILDNLKTGVVIHVGGKIVYVNEAIVDMLGYTNEPSVIGREAYDFIHPEDHHIVKNAVEDSIKNPKNFKDKAEMKVEVRFLKKDGDIVIAKNTSLSIDYYGEKARMAMIDNITDQKLAEEKIKISEKKYRSIFEGMPIAIWEEDFSGVKLLLDSLKKKGVKHFKKYFDEHPEFVKECADSVVIVDVNEEAISLHGASSKDDLLNNLTSFFLPETFAAFKEELVELAEGKNRYDVETVLKTKSGDIKQVHLKFIMPSEYETDFNRAYISIQDISSIKKTQLDLVNKQDKLNEVLNIANLGSFVFDNDIFEMSLIGNKIFGIDKSFKIDRESWPNLVHPEDLVLVKEFVNDIGVENGTVEFRVIRPIDKKIIWVIANIRKEHNESGFRTKITGTFRDFTESKLMIKSLRDSENMLNESQQVAQIGSYVINFEKDYWKGSKELFRIFGIDSDAKKNMDSWISLVHPDDKEMMREYFESNVVANRNLFNKEYRIINSKTKKTLWVHCFGAPKFDTDGNLRSMKGTIQDITETKIISEAFKKSNELLVNLSAQIPGAIYQFLLRPDGSSCFPYSSAGIKDVFGVTSEQIVENAQLALAMIHIDDVEGVRRSIQKSADNLSPWHSEYRVNLPGNKEAVWIEGQSIPQRLDDGSTLWHGLVTNIDNRKRVEEELKASERKFRSAVQLAPNPVMVYDEDGKVLQLSKGWTVYSGYTIDDIPEISDWAREAYGKEGKPAKDYVKNIFSTSKTENNGEWNVKTKSGEMRVWEFYTTALGENNSGKRILSSIAFDITDRNKAKKELTGYHETLEELVKDRTKELETKNSELDNAMKVFVGRELKIRELQKEVLALGKSK